MTTTRRTAVLGSLALAGGVLAQDMAARPLKLVVPFAAGGGSDLLARDLAEGMRSRLDRPVLVENKPGAGTMLGSQAVAAAPPDGNTLLLTSASFLISHHVYPKPLYDPVKDFAPVTQISSDFHIVVVNPRLVPARDLSAFVVFARAHAGKLSYATAGTASSPHIEGEWLRRAAGFDMTHIPYRGSAPAATALLGGEVQVLVDALATTLPHIRSGAMVPLAVPHARRSPLLPDVPTVAEALNLPDFQVDIMNCLLAPAGTPHAALQRCWQAVADTLSDPTIAARIQGRGLALVGSSPAEFGRYLLSENAKWQRLVSELSIRAE